MNERNMAVLSCLRMAVLDPFPAEGKKDIISIALQYGKSISLTRSECLRVLGMRLKDIFNIKKRRKR